MALPAASSAGNGDVYNCELNGKRVLVSDVDDSNSLRNGGFSKCFNQTKLLWGLML